MELFITLASTIYNCYNCIIGIAVNVYVYYAYGCVYTCDFMIIFQGILGVYNILGYHGNFIVFS